MSTEHESSDIVHKINKERFLQDVSQELLAREG